MQGQCFICKGLFEIQKEWIGQQAQCPYCKNNITIQPIQSFQNYQQWSGYGHPIMNQSPVAQTGKREMYFLGTWASFLTSIAIFAISALLIAQNDRKAQIAFGSSEYHTYHTLGIIGCVGCYIGIALFLVSIGVWLYRRFR